VSARFSWKVYHPGDQFQAEVWLVNDAPNAANVERVVAELDYGEESGDDTPDTSRRPVRFDLGACAIGRASAARVGRINAKLDGAPRALRLTCEARGEVIAANSYDLAVYLPPAQPIVSRIMRRAADWLLESG
jgi:hypothetical protein